MHSLIMTCSRLDGTQHASQESDIYTYHESDLRMAHGSVPLAGLGSGAHMSPRALTGTLQRLEHQALAS